MKIFLFLKTRQRFLVCVLIFAIGAACTIYAYLPKNTVILKDDGWHPHTLTIQAGETVTFKSERGESFWPASDFHPTHALYPAFDAKEPLAPDSSWSFTFTEPGTYTYHDHLAPLFKGVITIRGSTEEIRKACLALKAEHALSPECWGIELSTILHDKGLPAAFQYIDTMYTEDPRFRTNCHDVMHIVGAAAYEKFKEDSSVVNLPQTIYCGYGFYHGFIETMLVEKGTLQYAGARTYCESLEKMYGGGGSGPCFHGIGHAIFDSLEGGLWGEREGMVNAALIRCEYALSKDEARASCASGVFNAFANAMSAKKYDISFDAFDPVSFCSQERPLYQKGCFGEAGIGYIRNQKMTRSGALVFIESLQPEIRQYEYFIYFSDETKRMMANFPQEEFYNSCMALSDTARTGCIEGVLQGIREESHANQSHRTSFSFCKAFTEDSFRESCYDNVIQFTSRVEQDTAQFNEMCAAYTGRSLEACNK